LTIARHQLLQSELIPVSDIVFPEYSSASSKTYAAVLVPLVLINDEWHLLLTLRSEGLRQHGGEVAFPGGMWEEGDTSPIATALRETQEEIALPMDKANVLGGLDELETRRLTTVRPIVGIIPNDLSLQGNVGEIESIFTVPLSFFKQDKRLRTDIFKRYRGKKLDKHWVPAYQFDQYEIWGFTAAVIVQLMNRCFLADLTRDNRAPEKVW
jgi:8-oxo-dGTP pyrophosphatase MutT (NUDIX family)